MFRSIQWSSHPHVVAKVRSGWTLESSGTGGRCAIRARVGAVRGAGTTTCRARRIGPEALQEDKAQGSLGRKRQRVDPARIVRGEKTQKPGCTISIGRPVPDREWLVDPSAKKDTEVEAIVAVNGMWGCRDGDIPNAAGRRNTAKGDETP